MTHATRVLGVDPGLTRCGVAVIEGSAGQKVSLLHIGVFRTDPGEAIEQRLISIERDIDGLVDELEPDVVAVERVFSQHNVRTAMATAQAAAVALLVAARRGLPVAMHTPTEVKAAVTGNGRANKAQVTAMVTRVLRLDTPPKPADAADAAAIAICHAWRGVATQRLERARREMTSQRSSGTSTQQAAAARR
ncbi:MAG: crossover junction endodeoxyribonuclease RuvC [Actinomycetota bacterium]|nr:crossover junction endodeoxyribonuclease RuvC [Micrococcales bacterium]MEC7000535.1 crossover junction endodeoxyribonuclease RuvC [Actinomycetota bacterium]MAK39813.1 crossover junction endodeoxyribonuclease RuvC [Micrococcales bacterium]MEC8648882.1 crossover junction endodeoxyribonuclease RuvC [Actinomycetota bacterium]MEC9129443.1 crossover junction endodeoxyribonuclease RuvC [Actinomycetota bacterium]